MKNPPMAITRRRFTLLTATVFVAAGWTHGTPVAPPSGHLLNDSSVVLVDNSGNDLLAG